MRDRGIRFAAAAAAVLAAWGGPASGEEVVTLTTRPGVTIDFVLIEPRGRPAASAVLFMGGDGRIGLWRDPSRRNNNFLVRSRALFARAELLTAIVDVPSDRRQDGIIGFQDSEEYRADIAVVIGWLKARADVPVWLVGTSRGTVSAAFLAAALPVDGVVLTSSVTRDRRGYGKLSDAALARIRSPVLVVAHRGDECWATPAEDAPGIRAALTGSPRVEIMLFDGGDPPVSEPCQARSRHGFLGIEARVVGAIAHWIKAQGRR